MTPTAFEAVTVDEDYLDVDEVQTRGFGTCPLRTEASESTAYLGVDARGLTLNLILPASAVGEVLGTGVGPLLGITFWPF